MLQALPESDIVLSLAQAATSSLRVGLEAVLSLPSVPADAWLLARTPLRLGGLGLRDHVVLRSAARLASSVAVQGRALELGAHRAYVTGQLEDAVTI